MNIRYLKEDEIKGAVKLIEENYSKEYSLLAEKQLSAMFGDRFYKPKFMVAEDNGKILGFAGYILSSLSFRTYELMWVNVSKKLWNQGIGKMLINKILSEVKEIGYKNEKPCNLLLSTLKPDYFSKFGFETILKFKKGKQNLMVFDFEKKSE